MKIDMKKLERIQRTATKMVLDLKGPYEERWKEIGLLTLQR